MSKIHAVFLAAVLAAFSCAPTPATGVARGLLSAPASAAGSVNVRDFGAFGDNIADDRPAFAAALATGAKDVYVPNGTYSLGNEPGHFWALHIATPGLRLHGESREGVILHERPGVPDSVQLLEVNAPDVTIEGMTLDGDMMHQTVSLKQQRHGVRCKTAPRCTIRDLTAKNFTGDGIYIYLNSDDAIVSNVLATANQRNGLTLGGNTNGGLFVNSQFLGNGAEQFDSEGGSTINNVTIIGCTLDALGVTGDFVLTMTGSTATARSVGWTVTHNIVNGPVLALFIDDVVFAYNKGVNPTPKPSFDVYHTTNNVLVAHNDLRMTGVPSFSAGAIIWSTGTDPGQAPGGLVIEDNILTTDQPAYGVSLVCTRDAVVTRNTITGAGGAATSGIYVRTTRELEPVQHVTIDHNTITGFGQYGVKTAGTAGTAAKILKLEILGNTFAGGLAAMYLDGGNALADVTEEANTVASGLTKVSRPPLTGASTIDGTRWLIPAP